MQYYFYNRYGDTETYNDRDECRRNAEADGTVRKFRDSSGGEYHISNASFDRVPTPSRVVNRHTLIKELQRELSFRRKVYKAVDLKNERFLNAQEQRQYDDLKTLCHILEVMRDAEFTRFMELVEMKGKADAADQGKLF